MNKPATCTCFWLVVTLLGSGQQIQAQVQLNGYVKEFPMLVFPQNLSELQSFDNIVHNRLNFRWNIGRHWEIQAAQRTRFFYGDSPENPFFRRFLAHDFNGPVNLSYVVFNENRTLLHTITDRAFATYNKGAFQVRIGRQRINWGINTVTNPNDLFNNYSFFDFDYEERPGVDAIRATWFKSAMSRLEVAIAPGSKMFPETGFELQESVGALLYAFNRRGYDFQFITGYFHHRYAAGGGWAGSFLGAGIKGEVTWFYDIDPIPEKQAGNITAAISLDYRFKNGIFWISEVVWNQQRAAINQQPLLLIQPLRADNLTFSDWAIFSNASYPINLRNSAGLAAFYFPTENMAFISPSYTRSMHSRFDLTLLSQIFFADAQSLFGQAGYVLAIMGKYMF
jgi:hypothetical protein